MALDKKSKAALLAKMRSNQSKANGSRDPQEWRPKFKKDEIIRYKAFILPPLMEGDECLAKDGSVIKCKSDWDVWFVQHGHHFINKRKYQCPRIHGTGSCPMCDTGFELMNGVDDKPTRRAIAKEWLSQENRAVNIYFTDTKDNPEDLRGKVFWWNVPNAIFEQCKSCIDRNDEGPDEDDPQPYGLFFLPEEAYPVIIELKEKSEYNNYDGSKILSRAKAIADTEEEIEEILNKRVDVRLRIDEPDIEALTKIVDEKLAKTGGGFDDDDDDVKSESKSKKSEKKSEKESEPESESKSESKSKPWLKPKDDDDDTDDDDDNDDEADKDDKDDEADKDDDDDDEELDDEMKSLLQQLK